MSRCATVTLSFGSIAALCGIVLVAIGFGTSSWRTFDVQDETEAAPDAQNQQLLYSRSYGFFKFCFRDHAPSNFPYELSKSPLGYQCGDQQFNDTITDSNNDKQNLWIHMKRLYLGLYVAGLFLCLVSILTLLAGCIRSSYSIVVLTGLLFMFAGFFIAAAIGVWHKFVILDEEAIDSAAGNFYSNFPPRGPQTGAVTVDTAIRDKTDRSFGWSYMVAWIGVGLLELAAILMFTAACLISWSKSYTSQHMHDQHALVVPQAAYSNMAYEKGGGATYASPYAAHQMAYHPAYGTYGYHSYNPYAYYYASHYYPYSSNTLR